MELKPRHHRGLKPVPTGQVRPESDGFPWLQAMGVYFFTFNSIMSIKRSINSPWNLAFVVFSYLDLILLFWCLRVLEKTPEDSPKRRSLNVAVWSLTTVLTLMFSYKMGGLMPLVMKVGVWAMAVSSIGAGFYAIFIYKDKCCKDVEVDAAASNV